MKKYNKAVFFDIDGTLIELGGKILFEESLSNKLTLDVIEFFSSRGLDYLVETVEGCFFGGEADKNFYWIGNNVSPIEAYPHDLSKLRAAKISAPYNDEILKSFGELFAKFIDFVPHRYDCYMDIGPKGITKATGIEKVLDIFSIEKEETYAFGDDTNDLKMLRNI